MSDKENFFDSEDYDHLKPTGQPALQVTPPPLEPDELQGIEDDED